ncbi:Transcription initiation factor IIF subunit alpha [Apiospora phragmitis]|uniref:Transcription initiation factor IIF subunit alpha n=1 Tax=Apiospora phragmitis TaxID=2905665 RepID=A0ABR1X5M3_9PEZI
MSALPPGSPNGQGPTPPTSAAPLRKRKPVGNPLVPRQKPKPRPAGVHAPGTPMHANSKNTAAPTKVAPEKMVQPRGIPTMAQIEAARANFGGWSTPAPPGCEELPLILSKKGSKEGQRHHVMRLAPPQKDKKTQGLDPSDQNDFVRPVTLHRRDPRQPPPGREVKEEIVEPTSEQTEESEKLAQLKAEREAQREHDNAMKAPVMKDTAPKKNPKETKQKKPGTQVHYGARTEKQKKENEIRYEEALPWHLEDADGKHVWTGQYEAPLSDAKLALAVQNGVCRMIPLEKWYKFVSKRANVNALSIEEAEKVMSKKAPVSRWAMRDAQREKSEQAMVESRRIVNGGPNVKQESATFRSVSRREVQDHNELDVSGDEFQDDDETAGFEPDRDEDAKDSKDRVRREQLGANLFGDADEREVDNEEAKEKKEELERKLLGKDLKKALKKRDKQFQYDSDDSERERDPFASSSYAYTLDQSDSDSDSDDDEAKKEDDKDAKDKDKEKEKDKSGAYKGSDTVHAKKVAAESGKKGKSLKRAGSPGVSDSSGTESTRKKKAKTGPSTASLTGSRSSTPLMVGNPSHLSGSTSDGEATGGDMSDGAGGIKKKKKAGGNQLSIGTHSKGTPTGSRAGSPNPPSATSPMEPVTGADIIEHIPPQGISIAQLLRKFDRRVGDKPGQMARNLWIKLVKENTKYDSKTKLLSRKV